MELELLREYFPQGTNGEMLHNGESVCFTIELPWKNNEKNISCIPEGKYSVLVRCNKEFGWHLILTGVLDRDGILIHPANDALKELKGCIAPVTKITSVGCGSSSKRALQKLLEKVNEGLENGSVYLIIKKK